jgi:hypothetical protein
MRNLGLLAIRILEDAATETAIAGKNSAPSNFAKNVETDV